MKPIKSSGKNQQSANQGRKAGAGKGLLSRIIRGNKTIKGRRVAYKQFYNVGVRSTSAYTRLQKFAVTALANCRINARQLEAARRLIKKSLGNRGAFISVTAYPFAPVTRRPQDVRMGKGKGNRISNWICPTKKGRQLFEIVVNELSYGRNPMTIGATRAVIRSFLRVLEQVRIKLSVPVRIARLVQ
jgi:large subunit ribosomal protein L16